MNKKGAALISGLTYDDVELIERLNEKCNSIDKLRKILDRRICHNDKYDYLSLTVARLAYEFAREEYNALYKEAKRRTLV